MTKKLNEKLFTAKMAMERFSVKEGRLLYKDSGRLAGSLSENGYRIVSIRLAGVNRAYLVHRIIWLMFIGSWPKNEIDHINRNKQDNRIENLREATHSENSLNRGIGRNNSSGHKGVSRTRSTGKWRAYATVSGVGKFLGEFNTPDEAGTAYVEYVKKMHGEFICNVQN